MQTTPAPWGIHARLLAMAAVWGASWPWAKIVTQSMPPLTSSALRFLLASALLFLWLRHSGRAHSLRGLPARQWLWLLAAGATGVCMYAVFFMLGLQRIPASKAVVLITLNPVATLLLAAWLFKERINLWIGLGMGMTVVGAIWAITQGHPMQALAGGLGLGEGLILGCVASWAIYTLIGRKLQGMEALATVTVTSLIGAVLLLLCAWLIEGPGAWSAMWAAPARGWASLLAIVALATVLAYAWFFAGVKALGAGNAAAYISLVPIFGMGFSALWLGEALHISLAAGAALAVAGMLVMHFGRMAPGLRQRAAANRTEEQCR
ncbi:MAG: DMT family transporter [Comamonadaceae bacterium]|nr:DMT family transporter [Comamonadaceae bacterium]